MGAVKAIRMGRIDKELQMNYRWIDAWMEGWSSKWDKTSHVREKALWEKTDLYKCIKTFEIGWTGVGDYEISVSLISNRQENGIKWT